MKKEFGHVGWKVIIGYAALIIIAVFSLVYIYLMVEKIASEEDINGVPRQKIYLVTQTQTLLYESEAMGQLLTMEEDDYNHYHETLDRAHDNMDSLRNLVADDEEFLLKIDTIDLMIEQKRMNTQALMEIWQEANKDLYAKNIQKALATQNKKIEEQEIQEKVVTQKDTVIVAGKKRNFMKRLKEVFVPTDKDSSIVVSRNEQMVRDTLVNAYNPNEAISKTLRNIQSSVASERERLRELLVDRSAALRYDNSLINTRINHILRAIEEEELNASLVRMERRQELLGKTAYLITGIALLSVFVIIFFLVLIGRDLFKSRYYREKLEQAVLSREQLILTISHDVRAPLSSIIGYIELLQRSQPTEQQNAYLQNMGSSSKHILSLVNDLLDYQRLESGQMEVHEVPFRTASFFHEIEDSFRHIAVSKGLEFELKIVNDTKNIYSGDTVRIRQIVNNLVNNAIKFTQEGTVELLVDCSQLTTPNGTDASNDSQIVITVSDSGPGIAKDQQKKIFGEFARLSGAEKTEGFGLGLSITNRLVHLLGGKLDLQSEEGKGSHFTVTLPLNLADNQDLPEEKVSDLVESELNVFADGELSCLVIDDDLLQIALIEEVLKLNNVRVISCANPHLVLDFLSKEKVDLVISDIRMPGMDGFDLIKLIRSSSLSIAQSLPVVVISGSVGKDKTEYKNAGFTDFLGKPFTSGQLTDLLVRLFPAKKRIKKEQKGRMEMDGKSTVKNAGLDFSGITEFAGGDKEASAVILQTFFSETGKHIDALEEMLKTTDREGVGQVAHKLIPLFTMLGANVLVQQLRILELNGPELTDSGWVRLVTDVIKQASSIIELEKKFK